ncbi:MAG: hypothetical protein AUG08_01440 [Acidobacteria bacterium 13_1_20CM_2_55_15]|nr:MAG: hypothetical protein AUG08_01440 [Acidobacteria bacterium 13_1_20CM_2_55_15]
MSQTEPTGPAGDLEIRESPNGSLYKLIELARQAYEQKRIKDCLDLTRAILLIDPDNAQAQSLRSSMQSELHRNLENVSAFRRQAQSKEKPEKQSEPSRTAVPGNVELDSESNSAALIEATSPLAEAPNDSRPMLKIGSLVRATVLVLLSATVLSISVVSLMKPATTPKPVAPLRASTPANSSQQIQNLNAPEPELSWLTNSIETVPVPEPTPPAAENPSTTYRSSAVVPPPGPVAKEPQPVIAAAAGTLAVSSQTSVDIYKDDAYLGAAPVSLELPAGTHTLEYRHGGLRKYVTHVINSNETTKTTITFDVSVQINSKPWAAVFIDGVEKKALGQTPLSGVRVPIGSVLIFENPRFQTKTYRVTGNETGIQVVFQ